MMPIRFSLHWDGASPYTILVSIYAEDGTVAVSHGGVEIGQGINTKVCGEKEGRERERDMDGVGSGVCVDGGGGD